MYTYDNRQFQCDLFLFDHVYILLLLTLFEDLSSNLPEYLLHFCNFLISNTTMSRDFD